MPKGQSAWEILMMVASMFASQDHERDVPDNIFH